MIGSIFLLLGSELHTLTKNQIPSAFNQREIKGSSSQLLLRTFQICSHFQQPGSTGVGKLEELSDFQQMLFSLLLIFRTQKMKIESFHLGIKNGNKNLKNDHRQFLGNYSQFHQPGNQCGKNGKFRTFFSKCSVRFAVFSVKSDIAASNLKFQKFTRKFKK